MGPHIGEVLTGTRPVAAAPPAFTVGEADAAGLAAYRDLRRRTFVDEQGLFDRTDLDWRDEDPRTVVLLARDTDGTVLGGVRLGPADPGPDTGWWQGGRLVVRPGDRRAYGAGRALVRAACARAEQAGTLRFEATVQRPNVRMFTRLGWKEIRTVTVAGAEHALMRWPIDRIERLAAATKRDLAPLLAGWAGGPAGYLGDDGTPLPESDLVACCDAIIPSMVERDPEWAGWCSVLVNVNDLTAMGATPTGLLDAVAGRDRSFVHRVLTGLRRAAEAWDVPVLGGHTQLGVPAALAVTAFGRAEHPVPGGGGSPGHRVRVTADLGGDWRPGYTGRQWDSTSTRSTAELRAMAASIGRARPQAAKDVSMAGIVGTLGMLAEASGCGAELDLAAVPRPGTAAMGDWLTCFPGFAMVTADDSDRPAPPAGPAASAECGHLTAAPGVRLRWPDGETTEALDGPVTGMGIA
jgi:putative N-acetyltransferase (TIGR04045 family)